MTDLYEDQFDDTNTTDHRRRFADEAVTIGGRTRYNLRCPKCDRRRKRRPVTVPVKQDRLQSVCDLLAGAGEFAPTLTAFAAIVSAAQAANTSGRATASQRTATAHARRHRTMANHRPLRTTVPESALCRGTAGPTIPNCSTPNAAWPPNGSPNTSRRPSPKRRS